MPKRGLHGASTAGACGPVLYPRQNQQDRGESPQLLLSSVVSQQELNLKSHNNRMQFFSFFLPAFDVQQSKNKEARGQKEHFVF